ncbi:mucin-5AC-like [Ictalurus furcatus]|uniref:mucin-5AC-like n=1 Tax=Ictalurus furcatus TaxID=66913 RepID=UPI00234FFF1C|nr:mucin-5AC-like [Ictalurus furcatus]
MIPAPPLRWVLLFLFPTLSHQTSGSFSVEVQSPASGFLGSSVSLHCALVNNMDARNLEVSWYRPRMHNTPILSYKNTQIQKSPVDVQYQGRVFLLGELEKGDVSLKLENLTLADRGEYVCHVSSDNWYDEATVSLTVRVVGSTPVLSLTGAGGGQINVSCQSHGWLPEPSITWTDKEGRDLKHLSEDKFTNSSEGVVDVSSWLIVSPSASEWMSCSVGLSDQERKEGRIKPHAPAGVTDSWNGYFIVIPILLLLLLLLLCAAGITVYCKKGLIFSKRKWTEYTEGTPSETVPLSNICMENQDQNDAPSIIPHSVVVESREEDPGSSSFSSPGFSTAGSTTDKPNFTASVSHFKPAAPMSEMEPSAITSNPITAASRSNPTPPITSSNPTPAAPMSEMELSAITSNSTPTTTISETLLSDRPSNHTTSASAANPRLTITSSNPTPAATPSNPTPAATPSNPTPAATNTKHTTAISEPRLAAIISTPTTSATPSEPRSIATISEPKRIISISNPTSAAIVSNSKSNTTISNCTPAATSLNATPTASNSNYTPAATMSEPKHTATFSESATVPTTSAGQFIPVSKHPTNNAEQRRINIKQRKRKDRANERKSSSGKAEARETPVKSSSTENRKFKRLCMGEAADSGGESDSMNVDESTCSAPEEDTMDHESAADSHHVPPTEDLSMQCD